ncbi:hypothetical protein UA08_05458 [Talaromyces atroroseus]|uniref:Uncharacterized protein n=1 Tax=Talaromyces atroroseus TaxID=1441469 RepID=A0A225ACL5_TALAT|nr:hypothetical protein UA08_05458 [Talaromyces atroroseus]OKL58881.1 hypothetical protein UA08_05458 [Talaromyces atroroseus]
MRRKSDDPTEPYWAMPHGRTTRTEVTGDAVPYITEWAYSTKALSFAARRSPFHPGFLEFFFRGKGGKESFSLVLLTWEFGVPNWVMPDGALKMLFPSSRFIRMNHIKNPRYFFTLGSGGPTGAGNW